MTANRYPWPASAITPDDMALLHRVRESSPKRQPITRLIAQAVHEAYGHLASTASTTAQPAQERTAA